MRKNTIQIIISFLVFQFIISCNSPRNEHLIDSFRILNLEVNRSQRDVLSSLNVILNTGIYDKDLYTKSCDIFNYIQDCKSLIIQKSFDSKKINDQIINIDLYLDNYYSLEDPFDKEEVMNTMIGEANDRGGSELGIMLKLYHEAIAQSSINCEMVNRFETRLSLYTFDFNKVGPFDWSRVYFSDKTKLSTLLVLTSIQNNIIESFVLYNQCYTTANTVYSK